MKRRADLELLQGSCDLHCHTGPAMFDRLVDDFEAAREARDAGMKAIVLKDHHDDTSRRAYFARKAVPGIEVCGLNANIPLRHIQHGTGVPVYVTNVQCKPAGIFSSPMVVSMRPIPEPLVVRAVQVTSRFPATHGAPVHIGDPKKIGISNLKKMNWGDKPQMEKGNIPVFWACGVTPQAVAMQAKPELMITHTAGYMFISDIRDEELAAL